MRALSTSMERDAWLAALLEAFDSAERCGAPGAAHMLAEIERHLRKMRGP